MNIKIVVEKKRGCGYREPGGLYLVTDGIGRICGALPIELKVCPTCHQGIKPARGWTWVNIATLAAVRGCKKGVDSPSFGNDDGCGDCPIADAKIQTAGLLWVGEKFYSTPDKFSKEAGRMGISRRIAMVPKEFKAGETWVALAHRKAIPVWIEPNKKELDYKPGIFHIFKPSRIEYVVKEFDPRDKLERLEKRGITLVKVVKDKTEMKGKEVEL